MCNADGVYFGLLHEEPTMILTIRGLVVVMINQNNTRLHVVTP